MPWDLYSYISATLKDVAITDQMDRRFGLPVFTFACILNTKSFQISAFVNIVCLKLILLLNTLHFSLCNECFYCGLSWDV